MAIHLHETRTPYQRPPRGNLAMLREIVRTGQSQHVEGMPVTVAGATFLLHAYGNLSPHDQEVFAAACNTGFWDLVGKWMRHGQEGRKQVMVVVWPSK